MTFGLRLVSIVSLLLCISVGFTSLALATEDRPSISVVVDYNDGVQKHFTQVAWKSGMTVLDAMKSISEHPRGIKFSYRGKGSRALLYRIDDLENKASANNWLYRINGKLADRSFGIFEIEKGDTVLWKYGKFK